MMTKHKLALLFAAFCLPALSQDLAIPLHGTTLRPGKLPPLTVVFEPDCAPCVQAYTELVGRIAAHDPLLEGRPIRWVPVAKEGDALLVAARVLQKNSVDGLGAPIVLKPQEAYIEQVLANAVNLRNAKGYPMFMVGSGEVKTGYSNWSNFSAWLSHSR